MQLPEPFTDRIARHFGHAGQQWLSGLPQLLARCQQRWNLTRLSLSGGLSYNLILFAESAEFGAVALKLGIPHADLLTEMKALALYGGRHICACHDADAGLGALLLERILPGQDLTLIPSGPTRFQAAAALMAALPIPVPEGHGLPAYGDWLTQAFQRARAEGRAGPELLALVQRAELLFHEIESEDRPHLLLHGDLHHKNILRDRSGRWKAIDPKGAVGPACLEAARFMINEFWMGSPRDRLEQLNGMSEIFSRVLGESERRIRASAFVDYVLSTC